MKRLPVTLALASAVALAGAGTAAAAPAAAEPAQSRSAVAFAHGTFAPYVDGATAATYDLDSVPSGARASVFSLSNGGVGTTTKLAVSGLQPDRHYGAHVHDNPCGPSGDDAGPHFQYVQDPNQPSTDPEYANPDNEVWLDFTTNSHGTGFASSHVDWSYGDRRPASVVIHEHHTSTEPGESGDAGARLACINVDL
ncbi:MULTISPECIES: superoxide dismutase family protein [Prauserella salsuginis group]|uniref:Cu-Zn family superoxide dismutase n=2 Tax=Prauserella salsuginis group TaxID=2893672 RepID=A0A839XKH2_9PSEU|nr:MULTISPECIES: superoxide dismutase family protein [Prauserella salsuginis group]MBB3663067.1 Cu-Zn family superoxide dismutase [Prauserella sediminis]MCR3721098.1 superoxide dismutase, Cu-Zn family [Prauserella flava]MCR3734821.1 superoxide dismutase, Cu-Zn family [Prauserella salsuginis]